MNSSIRTAVAALAVLLATACAREGRDLVRVLTSTEVAGTGLPQALATRFSTESGLHTEVQIVDAARLRTTDYGDRAAVVITNDAATVERLRPRTRLKAVFARDDYVIIGPKRDPARVRDAATARDAFQRIASAKRPFCSAAGVPRFRAREAEIWRAAALDPASTNWYRLCRGDAKQLLGEVSRRGAYALVDRATLASVPRDRRPAVLLQGTPFLRNEYSIVLLQTRRKAKNAEWFAQWVMSYRGREVVDQHRIDGEKRFFTP